MKIDRKTKNKRLVLMGQAHTLCPNNKAQMPRNLGRHLFIFFSRVDDRLFIPIGFFLR
jgi:hypothetical protein